MYVRNLFFKLLFVGFLIISCSEKKSKVNELDLNKVPIFIPNLLANFDSIEDLYFSHLAYKSIATTSNHLVLADRQNKFVVIVDDKGALINKIREGRGPGEILDVYEMTRTLDNTIYLTDNGNKKILIYDEDLSFIKEFKPKLFEGTSIVNVFPGSENNFIFELTSFDFLENKDKQSEKIFVQYNLEDENYGKEIRIKDRPYARTYIDGRLVGAAQVPYSNTSLTSYNPENQSLFVYETSKSEIVELSSDFDTLNTIRINLPVQKLSDSEVDSLREGESGEQWKTMSSYLPEFKSEAEQFFYNNNRLWVQSNLRGDYQKWFVLNMKGRIIKIALLPKDGMVTHVSDENIGVRINDVEFAVYSNQMHELEK